MILLENIPVQNPMVVGRIVNDEAVLVLPVKGQVKVLNTVGARIWSLVDGRRTVGDIIAVIHTEFSVSEEEAKTDTCIFFNQLIERDIIMFSDNS